MANNDDNRENNANRTGGGNGGDGGRIYPNDPRYDFHDNVRRVFLAPGFLSTEEERVVYTRRLADLLEHNETAGAYAVALWSDDQCIIQERVSHLCHIPSIDMTDAQREGQREAERRMYGKLVMEHHTNQSARLLNDLAANAAHLIMTVSNPSDQLTAFIQNMEARIMALMQTAQPLEHEDYGRGNKKRKSDRN